MKITATDIAAWWGGLTGTILFVVELVRFSREGADFDVTFDYEYKDEFMMRQKPKALRYSIRNMSDKTTTITGISMEEWTKIPKRCRPMKTRFYSSGILDETAGKDYPQRLEPGDYIVGTINAETIREHAPKSCRPIVLTIHDTRHRRPKRIRLSVPEQFVAPLRPLDQFFNQLRLVGDERRFQEFVNALAKGLDLRRCTTTRDPSEVFHMDFPSRSRVEEPVIRGYAEAHGFQIKSINLNVELGE